MEFIVLGLLMYREMTIYDLNKSFSMGLSLIYAAGYGTLQYAVKRLQEKGLITFVETVENGRNKKIYMISEAGILEFHRWMEAETPMSKLETTALSKVFFLGLVDDDKKKLAIIEEVIEKITAAEKGLKNHSVEINQLPIPDELAESFSYQVKTLDYGIMSHSAAREWFTELLEEIKIKKRRKE
jgi:DNA-binding PadR family transcriptional regulator